MTQAGRAQRSRANPEGLHVTRHDWMASAACKGVDSAVFFDMPPSKALTYCYRCPVHQDCADYAHANNEVGVWGGLTDRQRARGLRYMPELPKSRAKHEAELERQILELHRSGVSYTQITKLTGVHTRNIFRILQRRTVAS